MYRHNYAFCLSENIGDRENKLYGLLTILSCAKTIQTTNKCGSLFLTLETVSLNLLFRFSDFILTVFQKLQNLLGALINM